MRNRKATSEVQKQEKDSAKDEAAGLVVSTALHYYRPVPTKALVVVIPVVDNVASFGFGDGSGGGGGGGHYAFSASSSFPHPAPSSDAASAVAAAAAWTWMVDETKGFRRMLLADWPSRRPRRCWGQELVLVDS